jgi:hypothetical protein
MVICRAAEGAIEATRERTAGGAREVPGVLR